MSTLIFILFVTSFVALLVFGNSIALAIGLPSLVFLVLVEGFPLSMLARRLAGSLDSFPLLAAPLFILAGNLMNNAGITNRIFRFANASVGHLTGGLAHANVVASVIFSGMSGSALADAGGLGSVEIKAMTENGYSKEFSVGVTGASSIIGPIIPPSIPMVIYAVVAGQSVGRLFIAGIIPGIIMGLSIMIMCVFVAKKEKVAKLKRATLSEFFRALVGGVPSLFTIVIILGGIMGGIFTPTEASAVAVVYVILLGTLVYRTITWKKFINVVKESALTMIRVSFIIGAAALFGQVVIREQIASKLATFMIGMIGSPAIILLLLNVMMLILGTFMETIAAIMIVTPVALPLLLHMGYSPVQFGVVAVLNLMIGLLTPPVGIVLYALSDVGKLSLSRTIRGILPFLIPLVVSLFLITYISPLTLFLPRLVFGAN